MLRFARRSSATLVATGMLLAACAGGTDPTVQPTATVEVPATASAEASPALTPEPTAIPSVEPSPSLQPPSGGAFVITPDPAADSLFLDRDECENRQDGYELQFPDAWYTNTEIRDVPACSWFSPEVFTVDDFDDIPDEIAIEIFWLAGDRGYHGEILARDEGIVGGQYAARVEVEGTPDDATGGTSYEYVIQLGPTPEEGPNLVARTDTDMGGDYELNRAVLDRMMATIEFVGSVQ